MLFLADAFGRSCDIIDTVSGQNEEHSTKTPCATMPLSWRRAASPQALVVDLMLGKEVTAPAG